MKKILVTTKVEDLRNATGLVSKVISSNPVIPLLGNILLDNSNGEAILSSTNLEMGISCRLPLTGGLFKTCVPSKLLAGMVSAMYSDEVELLYNEKDQSITFMTEESTSNIKCVSADEFPDIPKVERVDASIGIGLFKSMVQRVAFAANSGREDTLLGGGFAYNRWK